MSLLKKEIICESCDTQFILVFNEEDEHNVSYCPFCSTVLEEKDSVEDFE